MNKKLFAILFVLAIGVFLSGCAAYYPAPAYSSGYVSVSTPNFAFSIGEGVNAYYAPAFGTYIYGYNGYYYRWLNGGWFYASVNSGPWYSVGLNIYIPTPLLYGPPPPVYNSRPYFTWWRTNIAPWYRMNHPGWWGRHHMFMHHYNMWQRHTGRIYENHPFYRGGMRQNFQQGPQQRNMVNPNQGGMRQNFRQGPGPNRHGPNQHRHHKH